MFYACQKLGVCDVVASFCSNGVKDGSLQVVWIPSTVQKNMHARRIGNLNCPQLVWSVACLPSFPTVTARMSSGRNPTSTSPLPTLSAGGDGSTKCLLFLPADPKWTSRSSISLVCFWLDFDSSLTFAHHLVGAAFLWQFLTKYKQYLKTFDAV